MKNRPLQYTYYVELFPRFQQCEYSQQAIPSTASTTKIDINLKCFPPLTAHSWQK